MKAHSQKKQERLDGDLSPTHIAHRDFYTMYVLEQTREGQDADSARVGERTGSKSNTEQES